MNFDLTGDIGWTWWPQLCRCEMGLNAVGECLPGYSLWLCSGVNKCWSLRACQAGHEAGHVNPFLKVLVEIHHLRRNGGTGSEQGQPHWQEVGLGAIKATIEVSNRAEKRNSELAWDHRGAQREGRTEQPLSFPALQQLWLCSPDKSRPPCRGGRKIERIVFTPKVL